MRIVILGAGRVGESVAESLVSERNDITLIDPDAPRLRVLEERLDLRGVPGNGIHPSTLERAGIGWGDIEVAELNEAFAAQSLACLGEWDLDPERLNVNGGAIAIGHPLGASGVRILGTLVHELRRRGGGWGIAAICIGVGQGLAVVVEA